MIDDRTRKELDDLVKGFMDRFFAMRSFSPPFNKKPTPEMIELKAELEERLGEFLAHHGITESDLENEYGFEFRMAKFLHGGGVQAKDPDLN